VRRGVCAHVIHHRNWLPATASGSTRPKPEIHPAKWLPDSRVARDAAGSLLPTQIGSANIAQARGTNTVGGLFDGVLGGEQEGIYPTEGGIGPIVATVVSNLANQKSEAAAETARCFGDRGNSLTPQRKNVEAVYERSMNHDRLSAALRILRGEAAAALTYAALGRRAETNAAL
jgi:hypothetical protein